MNLALWVATVLLVAVFGFSAAVKGTQTTARAVELGMTGVRDIPLGVMRFTAVCEVLGIVGVIVPYLTGIVPALTPAAAIGLGLIMVLAAGIHLRLNEPRTAMGNLAILALCVFVAAGRWPN